jgi:hypothetical protein
MKIKTKKAGKQARTVKEMTITAGSAMKNGFYTETIWILSGIMELRLKKLVILTEGKTPGAALGLEQYLKRIRHLQSKEMFSVLKTEFPLTLISSLRSWKNNRNIMMKDMLEMHVSNDRKERLAKEGISLLKALNKVYKHYKLAFHEQSVKPCPDPEARSVENQDAPKDSSPSSQIAQAVTPADS